MSGEEIIDLRCYFCGYVVHGNCDEGNGCVENERCQMASECTVAMAMVQQSLRLDKCSGRPSHRVLPANFLWTTLPARFLQ